MNLHDPRKRSLWFPEWVLDEMRAEATRLERSLSWVAGRAWKIARKRIAEIPGSTASEDRSHGAQP